MSLIMTITKEKNICGFSGLCKGFHKEKEICNYGSEQDKYNWCPLFREMHHFINASQIDVGLQEFDYELKSKLAGP